MSGNVSGGEPILSVRDLAVHFGGLVAIERLSFHVAEGRVTSLIGPNGAGKTTAFNVITGFLAPTHGEMHYRGERERGAFRGEGARISAEG